MSNDTPLQPPRTQRPHKSAVRLWIDSVTAPSKSGSFKAMYEGLWDTTMHGHGMMSAPMGIGKTSALIAAEHELTQRIRLQSAHAELRAQMRDIIGRVAEQQAQKDGNNYRVKFEWPLHIDSLPSLPAYDA